MLPRNASVLGLGFLIAISNACGCGNGNDNSGGRATPTATVTPTSTATPAPQIPCPEIVTYIVQGEESDFDTGSTGIYFDQKVGDGGSLSFAVDCPGDFLGACGVCAISGPVRSTTVSNNHRCQNATNVACTSDADCPGSACAFFFGSPVPVSAGGFPVCVTNRVVGDVTGTISPELGAGSSDIDIVLSIFTGLSEEQPCPVCTGADTGASGVCAGGQRDGESCVTDGTIGVFGNTSFDCPPNPSANIGNSNVPLDLTTGIRTLEASNTCTSGRFAGRPCYCANQREPNACLDGLCTVDAQGEGTCEAGPVDKLCQIETFRACLDAGDCPAAGDTCTTKTRKCAGPTNADGDTTAPLTRTGAASPTAPLQVAAFCIDATSSPSINAAAGFPGPAAIRLPTLTCIRPTCP